MPAAATRATFSDFRLIKTRKVAQLVFEVPIEEADGALQTLGGLPRSDDERWCGIALLKGGDALHAICPDPARSARAKERYREKDEGERAVVRAILLAQDSAFGRWCGCETCDDAADHIRLVCGVDSRRELASNPEALKRFLDLEFQYAQHVGRAPVDMSA